MNVDIGATGNVHDKVRYKRGDGDYCQDNGSFRYSTIVVAVLFCLFCEQVAFLLGLFGEVLPVFFAFAPVYAAALQYPGNV